MARVLGKLSSLAIGRPMKPGLHSDGGGLYLQVTASGVKTWIFRYRVNERRRDMGLGPLHTVSLSQARSRAAECRTLRNNGKDPIEARRDELARERDAGANRITFQQAAGAYIDSHRAGWRNAKHADQWTNTLTTYAYPIIGEEAVGDVTVAHVMRILDPIWREKTETASRVRGRIESVLDWATAQGHRQGENPARWRGHLENLLPPRARVQKVTHHPALPYTELPEFLRGLAGRDASSANALLFLILTATRTSEAINAEWSEIDIEAKLWTIPATRMKAGREHRVPLSDKAIQVVKNCKKLGSSRYIFPGGKAGRPLSNMALLTLLKRMGRSDLTAHGFRSTFRDWAAEQTNFSREVAEMALAHSISDKVEAAYRRGDLFDKRREMMDAWSAFALPTNR